MVTMSASFDYFIWQMGDFKLLCVRKIMSFHAKIPALKSGMQVCVK